MPQVGLDEAELLLRAGELLIFPTETVYGIGCDPRNHQAVAKLVLLKDRPSDAGMPLLLEQSELMDMLACDPSPQHRAQRQALQAAHWPGALTLVVDVVDSCNFATAVAAADGSLALRYSPLLATHRLASACGGAVIATSANRRGKPPAQSVEEALQIFPEVAVLALESLEGIAATTALPSTIVDVRSLPYTVVRQGAVTL